METFFVYDLSSMEIILPVGRGCNMEGPALGSGPAEASCIEAALPYGLRGIKGRGGVLDLLFPQ